MANLAEVNEWVEGIYQLEEDDPVMGGADGVDNRPHKELANRTKFLKLKIEKLAEEISKMDTVENHNQDEDAHSKLLALFAKLESPILSGIPKAPTATKGTNSNQIATMAALLVALGDYTKTVNLPANAGGIIAGSLAQNGWVKFANGLILQWGLTQTGYNLVNSFPISFSEFVYTVQITLSNNFSIHNGPYSSAPAVKDITLTSFTALFLTSQGGEMSNSNGRWLAIGF